MLYKIFRPLKKCDIAGIGAAVSGVAGAASSVYAADRQFEATRETNEANKQLAAEKNALDYQVFEEGNEFNRIEAEKNRAFQEQMQTRQERYNSLPNQIAQATQAGINPASVAGGLQTTVGSQSGSQASSMAAPSFTAAHMQTPDLSALQGISQAFGNFAQSQLALSQSEKVKTETAGQIKLNQWIDKEKEAGIKRTRAESAKAFAEAKKLQQDVLVGKEEVKKIRGQVALLSEQTFAQNVENAFKAPTLAKQYEVLSQELKIKEQQAKRLVETFVYDVAVSKLMPKKVLSEIDLNYQNLGLSKENAEMFKKLADLYKTQNDQAVFDLGVDEDFKELLKGSELLLPVFKLIAPYLLKKK